MVKTLKNTKCRAGPSISLNLQKRDGQVTTIAQEEKSGQMPAMTSGGVANLQVQEREREAGGERDKESHNGRQFGSHKSTSIYLATPEE